VTTARTGWRILAVALALAAAACMIVWSDRSTRDASPDPGVATAASTRPIAESPDPAQGRLRVAALPRPVRLTIPVLGVATELVRLGLQPDGTVEVPTDPALAGWYHLGMPPGGPGSAVILGHVDSADGPAVFAGLAEVEPGSRIRVGLDDGSTATFVVRTVRTYANADFPARRVYVGHGRRELNLVTCGGAYEADRGGYQANVVVNAVLVAPNRATRQ